MATGPSPAAVQTIEIVINVYDLLPVRHPPFASPSLSTMAAAYTAETLIDALSLVGFRLSYGRSVVAFCTRAWRSMAKNMPMADTTGVA